MTYPLVRDLAAEGFSVRLACGVLGFSTQAYYAWCKDPVPQRDLEDAYAINALIDAHADDPAFGYRFLADQILSVDAFNPMTAARLVEPLGGWRRYKPELAELMRAQLERIAGQPKLSKNVLELATKALG